ncbi:MAG TPA: hypothetical protein VGR86_15435 [Steroidobacteraceae bacterium]|nr:hypothetical protein [Steroidobacteraceae bacterium]
MRTLLMLLAAMAVASAHAQQSAPAPAGRPPAAAPTPDQLEPAVDTTAATTPEAAPAPAARLTPKGDKAAAAAGAAGGKPAPAASDAAGSAKAGTRGPKGPDRVELETTEITGNRELPKVLYIVPWKRSDLGDIVGKPANSLLDEVLQPIDRDVFMRENRYYEAVKPDAAGPKAGTVAGSGDRR